LRCCPRSSRWRRAPTISSKAYYLPGIVRGVEYPIDPRPATRSADFGSASPVPLTGRDRGGVESPETRSLSVTPTRTRASPIKGERRGALPHPPPRPVRHHRGHHLERHVA